MLLGREPAIRPQRDEICGEGVGATKYGVNVVKGGYTRDVRDLEI